MRFSEIRAHVKGKVNLYVLPLFFFLPETSYYSMQKRSKGICEDVHRASAREDGRGSFGDKRRKNSTRFGSRALQNILSRNCPAGVTSSESISHAFNIERRRKSAGRQCYLRGATRDEGRGEGDMRYKELASSSK